MKSTAKATEKRSRTVVVLAIAVALMLLGSIFAQMFNTSFYKVKVSRISFDTDSGTLSGLLYMPKGVDASNPHPTIVTTHGYLNSAEMQDETAIERSKARLAPWAERITFVHGNFRSLGKILDDLGIDRVNGMLFDLGVSSPQLDEAERGFSYMADAPLDMRMDQSAPVTAWTVVNTWPERELVRILRDYGEERYANRIAGNIVRAREKKPVETTLELVDIIKSSMPGAALREKQHPAKRSFQAIRIAVNDELEAEREMLLTAMDRLAPGGRLCVISFHSLEDRIVKTAIREREDGCTCPRDFPVCVCGR